MAIPSAVKAEPRQAGRAKGEMGGKTLLLFNLKTDASDDVFGFTTDWINALAGHFRKIHVLTMHAGTIAVKPNVSVVSVGKERGFSDFRRGLMFYAHLIRILATGKIDYCFGHMMPLFLLMGAPFLKLRRIPMLLWFSHTKMSAQVRLVHRLVDRVVTSNRKGFDLESGKVSIVGHGITDELFPVRARRPLGKPFTVVSLSRLSEGKAIHVMIRAIRLIQDARGPGSIRLLVAGGAMNGAEAAYRDSLLRLVSESGLGKSVEFVGAVPHREAAAFLGRGDLALNLAETGSLDKAPLEAMATGIPILLRNRAFERMLAEYGLPLERFLLPSGGEEILAERIQAWMDSDPEADRPMLEGMAGRVRAEFGVHALAERIIGVMAGMGAENG